MVMLLIVAAGVFGWLGDSSRAADETYITGPDGVQLDPSVTVNMRTKTMQLNLHTDGNVYEDTSKYEVEWIIATADDPDVTGTENRIAKVSSSEQSQTIGIVTALSPGNVTVTVLVKDKTITDDHSAIVDSAICNIRVVFAVDTSVDDSVFKTINSDDSDRSLLLYTGAEKQMELNFGKATDAQWTSSNDEVVTVGLNTGKVKAVGAGKAEITVTYTPEGEMNTYTALLTAYVVPRVSRTNEPLSGCDPDDTLSSYKKTLTDAESVISSGEYVYTDTSFTNNLQQVRQKIIWVVKKDKGDGTSEVIADSLGMDSDLINVVPIASKSNGLQITGVAGEYDLYFYTTDTYRSDTDYSEAYTPSVIHLTILSNIGDKSEIIHIGDSYDFSAAFNMTLEDFRACFAVANKRDDGTEEGTTGAENYITYTDSTATMTANAKGNILSLLTIRSGQKAKVAKLLGTTVDSLPSAYKVHIQIIDSIYLDRNNLTIFEGQTYQLNLVLNAAYNGTVTWESSDERYVTVDENGLITGMKKTESDVTVTATLDTGEGPLKTATCIVKVEETVKDFTLSPDDDQQMMVGEHLTVVADIKQAVTVAPLTWISSDTKVFDVKPAADGKSATITAVAGGTAVLTVLNTVNNSYQTLRITVRVPINKISFDSAEMEIGLYKEGFNMKSHVTIGPADATEKELTWMTSDSSIITVDEDGYMSLHAPGVALITVYPTYNPNQVMTQCQVTVLGTPTSMVFSETDMTFNVGDNKTIEVEFMPGNTLTELAFTPVDDTIVDIKYDEERKLVTFNGKNPGSTTINVVSREGLISNLKVNVKQPATGLALDPEKMTLLTGESASVKPVFTPENSTDRIEWKSLDTSIATVNEEGRITGIAPGVTFIQGLCYNGEVSGPTALIQVTVQDGLKGISLDSYEKTVEVGSNITLTPIFEPETAANKNMKWTVSNSSIASIEPSGASELIVTGVAAGTTMVTGVSEQGGYTVSCLITVTEKAEDEKPDLSKTKVTVSPKTKILQLGKTFHVKATVKGAANKKVKWKSSNKKVCSVTSGGKVKGRKVGTAYIKATAKDGSGASARCRVRVVRKVTKLRLNRYTAEMYVSTTLKLKATVRPKNATIKKIKWTTSDPSIATVSETGRVLALAPGLVQISAETTDTSNKKATCIINVKEPVEATGVTVTNSNLTIVKGESMQSGITVAPANSTTAIKYYSDNPEVASVDKRGKITTHRVGQATIYGETKNGKVGYCDVLVIDLNRKEIVMRQYDTEQLYVNQISIGVTWYSKDINIATVSSSGLVTGRRKGTTIIYANVNGVKLGCRVRIKKIK